MNYEKIAEMVHDLVKNSKSMLSQEPGLSWTEIKTSEFISQRFFSEYQVAGDARATGVKPQLFWG